MTSSASSLRPSGAPSLRGRVLIIDDNTALTQALEAVLQTAPEGLSVSTAESATQGLAMARVQGFDVAIVDVSLPDGSGVDLIEPLREASPFGEVVLITGFASVEAAILALRAGAFALVLKSFRPEELIGTVEQALQKVRLQRERDELERRHRDLVELTNVLVLALDSQDRVVLMNRKAAGLLGLAPEAALGQEFLSSWVPEAERELWTQVLGAVRSEVSPRAGEHGSREVEGTLIERAPSRATGAAPRRRVRWLLSRSSDAQRLVYGIGIDVTERRSLEKRAADAEAMSAMGALALNLAHEIRNPLNAALLQLHLLGRDVDKLSADDQGKDSLKRRAAIVGDEVGRLNRLLTEFLELARPRGIAREPVHIGTIVDGVVELQQGAALGRSIRLHKEIAPDGCVALGDAEKLTQVVLNLVVNALEAMKNGGTLTARVYPETDRVLLEITDTGPGIPEDVLENVFDPFFTTKEAGTGLGLSIVRKIVDQHGGDVQIRSESTGTRVTVSIPTGR
jgi:PAS domain S-box-containing protein